MKKLLFLVALFLLMGCNQNGLNYSTSFSSNSNSSKKEAILKLDTKGHTALIRDIIVTKEGDIISASDDKTIRVWDSTTGKEKRKILITTKNGTIGQVYSIAISKNEKFLAVSGRFKRNFIKIFDYQTGKLLYNLKSHTNIIFDLSFSKDGKYLISGSADRTVKIWDSTNFNLKNTIKFHKNNIMAVNIIESYGTPFSISIGQDNRIALYNIKIQKVVKSIKSKNRLYYLAVSPKHIAVAGHNKEITIYDYSLNPIKTILTRGRISSLSFSPNGKYLLVGTHQINDNVYIYDASHNYIRNHIFPPFKNHTSLITAVGFLDNKTAISAGGFNYEIYVWDIRSTKIKTKIIGDGEIIWNVGINKNIIGWGDKKGIKKYFDLNNMKVLHTFTKKLN